MGEILTAELTPLWQNWNANGFYWGFCPPLDTPGKAAWACQGGGAGAVPRSRPHGRSLLIVPEALAAEPPRLYARRNLRVEAALVAGQRLFYQRSDKADCSLE